MDQIADLLVRIKNASLVSKREVNVPFSKVKEAILKIMKNEGFLSDCEIVEQETQKSIKITISKDKTPMHIKQLSKRGRKLYAKNKEIPNPLRGFGTVIISTSKGMITGKEAKKLGLGGELICEIW